MLLATRLVSEVATWRARKEDILPQLKVTARTGEDWLKEREAELATLCAQAEKELKKGDAIRIEVGKLVVSPLTADALPESAKKLQEEVTNRLPRVDLSDVLIEMDGWTHASSHLKHVNGNEPKTKELLTHLYAIILAHSHNMGLQQMADSAGFSYDRFAWANMWYLREETLKAAFSSVVDFQYHQPFSLHWGNGTLSSSDGQRFPVSVKTKNATALPRYFAYGKGLQYYTWTSDQFSQYGARVAPATIRDALYVLDAILDNETELPILEHTTDTAGYTELVFALFHLLGLQFSPRLRDLSDQTLYRISKDSASSRLIRSTINQKLVINYYDDLLRVAGSLKTGWVTASLLISKLQAYPQQNILTQALQECGRMVKTISILKYLTDREKRWYIMVQLNKGEAIHSLRHALFFANEGVIRKHHFEDQTVQLYCLNFMTNAVITWNTVYMQEVIDQLRKEGYPVREEDIIHLSPARHEHINFYGKYFFNVSEALERKGLRPLRKP